MLHFRDLRTLYAFGIFGQLTSSAISLGTLTDKNKDGKLIRVSRLFGLLKYVILMPQR